MGTLYPLSPLAGPLVAGGIDLGSAPGLSLIRRCAPIARTTREGNMSHHRKSTTALTGLIVTAVLAGTYLMGRSDERAGRPFSLATPAQAADVFLSHLQGLP